MRRASAGDLPAVCLRCSRRISQWPRSSTGRGEGAFDAKIVRAGGERSYEDEESFTLTDTPQASGERPD